MDILKGQWKMKLQCFLHNLRARIFLDRVRGELTDVGDYANSNIC